MSPLHRYSDAFIAKWPWSPGSELSMNGLGYELVGSYLTQVHLQHVIEFQRLRPLLSDNDVYIDVYIKVEWMVCVSDRSEFKTGRNYCAAHPATKISHGYNLDFQER